MYLNCPKRPFACASNKKPGTWPGSFLKHSSGRSVRFAAAARSQPGQADAKYASEPGSGTEVTRENVYEVNDPLPQQS